MGAIEDQIISKAPKKTMQARTCPKCAFSFDASANRTYKGMVHDIKKQTQEAHKPPETWIDETSQVKCPKCGEVFVSQAIEYFGFLSSRGIKVLIGLFVFAFLVAAILILIKSI